MFERTVSRGSSRRYPGLGVAAWYCRRFGILPLPDWPIAALLAAAFDGDRAKYWLCADPTHLVVDRDCLVMMPAPPLSDQESADLFESVKTYIDNDRLQLLRIDAMHWCVGCDDPQELSSTEPSLAAKQNIDDLLLRGRDAARWLRLGTELQMLIHGHPITQARESRGNGPINSLWFWGGGVLPPIPRSSTAVAARTPLPRALASLSGAPLLPVHDGLAASLDAHTSGNLVVDVDRPVKDASPAGAETVDWEQAWFVPAWRALMSRQFDRMELVGLHGDGMIEFCVDRSARWKFWRRADPALLSDDVLS